MVKSKVEGGCFVVSGLFCFDFVFVVLVLVNALNQSILFIVDL
jgi:hypothetical protein